eukprot:TRINITY_DN60080_c0_g1_i1.p1 TRINITY_DN60080_c0_g1~~TRINITY_DN60080_c0_g1_i1.p1  ORF type:complete len:1344 (+),score=386.91 TRINITY_DN60080_c0_g1_i1:94-4032(+)
MITLTGKGALSGAKEQKILAAINSRLARPLSGIYAEFAHYLKLREGHAQLSEEDKRTVLQCLDYGFHFHGAEDSKMQWSVTVTPRKGTTTPWSSKATDILGLCLHPCPVQRIERGMRWRFPRALDADELRVIADLLHDRMTQTVLAPNSDATEGCIFSEGTPAPLRTVRLDQGALQAANKEVGLALQPDEIAYIAGAWPRDPTDVELFMFAQVNSEHCRHKIFNARWLIDDKEQQLSLFQMIKNTHRCHPEGVLSAYADNAAVLEGHSAVRFFADPRTHRYRTVDERIDIVIKVETHNHPTAVSPFPGASTGSGGEIRDEGATGIGGKPKAGITGFSVSHLLLPGAVQPWEDTALGTPGRIATARQIMLEAPIGGASFNNEFGRPNICGYFRSFLQKVDGRYRGYHKPIMLAGGLGNIRPQHIAKRFDEVATGCHVVVLGGPAMMIGLGGGAASSMASGASCEHLDYASVQRENPELQRRCQEVIDGCWALGADNPILCIHDVGAGGLSNAVPELLHDSGSGGKLELRLVPNQEPGMSPMAIWCNEAQERYVMLVSQAGLAVLKGLCQRERCPYAVLGQADKERLHLTLTDSHFGTKPIDLPMDTLFGKPPRMTKTVRTVRTNPGPLLMPADATPTAVLLRVLANPSVACKSFLITIGDRSVTGLIARDQMVGRWQVPVADCAVTLSSHGAHCGEAMACGERPPLALIDGPASAGIALGEALTNLLAADVRQLTDVRCSANWMVNSGEEQEDYALYRTCEKLGMDLAPQLGVCIPVGKDSMSMKTIWKDPSGEEKRVTAPVSLVITAFAPVGDVRLTVTPDLQTVSHPTSVVFADLSLGRRRLSGSIAAQCYGTMGAEAPDMPSCDAVQAFARAMVPMRDRRLALAYHDRSDGGLATTLCEMCFAGHLGLTADISTLAAGGDASDLIAALFCEELGVALQVDDAKLPEVRSIFAEAGFPAGALHVLGPVTADQRIVIRCGEQSLIAASRAALHRVWAETSYRMQALRDNPECAQQEYDSILDTADPGLSPHITFDIPDPVTPAVDAPTVAILREQGINGQVEMAWAFRCAGFTVEDVHMSDILSGQTTLKRFRGVVCCGGFSYGDTLGAGRGWASTILHNSVAREEFRSFFARPSTFTLGICNGCQMMAELAQSGLIPGAEGWPRFTYNESGQFEARVCTLLIDDSPSIFMQGMGGSRIPVAVAHGEGRAEFADEAGAAACAPAARYVDNWGKPTMVYPLNPNGSPGGLASVTSADGRATLMMPHPERVVRTAANSWTPDCEQQPNCPRWGEYSPWLKFFRNARLWCARFPA